jgi:hypothetical protein
MYILFKNDFMLLIEKYVTFFKHGANILQRVYKFVVKSLANVN